MYRSKLREGLIFLQILKYMATKILKVSPLKTSHQKFCLNSLRDRVVLYINCQEVGERPIDVVDSRIDLSGEILVAKEADNGRTTAIDLQWMVMSCDPESVERETCDELPVSIIVWTVTHNVCNSPSNQI